MQSAVSPNEIIHRRVVAHLERSSDSASKRVVVQEPPPQPVSALAATIAQLLDSPVDEDHAVASDASLTSELARLAGLHGRLARDLARRVESLMEVEQQLISARETLAMRDAKLAELGHAVATRDTDLLNARMVVERLRATIETRDASLAELGSGIQARDARVIELERLLQSRDEAVIALDKQLAATDSRLNRSDDRVLALEQANQQLLRGILTRDETVQRLTTAFVSRGLGPERETRDSGGNQAARLVDIQQRLIDPGTLTSVRALLTQEYAEDRDPNLDALLGVYDAVQRDGLPYWDMRIAARAVSAVIRPSTYLEIGTRRGWSLAQVFAESPSVHAYVFDMWVAGYGDTQQGSPDFIRERMQRVAGDAQTPFIEFVNGNSHDTLPPFFAGSIDLALGPRPDAFDIVTVDGDHTRLGAWWDLYDVFPHVRVGGAVLFDDLDYGGDEELGGRAQSRHERPPLVGEPASLLDVWLLLQKLYPNFVFLSSMRHRYRTGIAFRLR